MAGCHELLPAQESVRAVYLIYKTNYIFEIIILFLAIDTFDKTLFEKRFLIERKL